MKQIRNQFKSLLCQLAAKAVKKHDMELIVVTGFVGSEIVKEGIYNVLNQKYAVRRNTNQILWDMALPLAVLGYEDKRRNGFEWLVLMFRASFYIAFGRKNKHILVLNANCTFKETAQYWSDFLKPDYLVVLDENDESPILEALLHNLKSKSSKIIYNKDRIADIDFAKLDISRSFSFSKKSGDLVYSDKDNIIKYNKKRIKIPSSVPKILMPKIAAIFGTLICYGYSLEEVGFEGLKFDLGQFLANRIKTNLGKERSN